MKSTARCQSWKKLFPVFIFTLFITVIVIIGCKSAPAPAEIPTPTSTPELTQLSFSLVIEPPQEYTEHTIPIYLRSAQTLHFNWRITKGGDSLWIAVTTPSGKIIGAKANGGFNDYATCEKLIGMGNIIFRPSDYGCGDGYYLFRPHIGEGDGSVTIEALYWIED